ncbi:MAG: acyl-CoA dehydrogenase [Myxococcales bacterium]|nr:acyl-CoA dehydrogenase [Myxococcales bacterium]
MAQPINRYKADLRDFRFLLFEHFKIQDILGKPPFQEWGEEECSMILDEVYRFACEVTGPLNPVGDAVGCRLENGEVKVPAEFHKAWQQLWEAGWASIGAPVEMGGQGAPSSLQAIVSEMLSGSNTAFNMYPGLTLGAAEVIQHFGTERQKKLYVPKMMDGTFGGTMCLTEPHAGSDVGAATTTAYRREDGKYLIKGTKIFISGGDHDMVENIIHLVLARIEGAEPGTKGLSLFIVPKRRVDEDGNSGEANDVAIPSIEHKMGIKASATCVVQFGDDDACIGELVGEVEHQGMTQMFMLMNFARIGVGIQGLSVAGSAYLNALDYAKERKQGSSIEHFKDPSAPRAEIIRHPNIRKDLLDMKARVEGIRALIIKLSSHQDRIQALGPEHQDLITYHQGQVNLLTPLVKAYGSDQAFHVCERAIQTFGGHGYLADHPVEQYMRDAKIFSIYEGTNAIQSMDLVGRKLGQAGGNNVRAFLGDIQKFIDANKEHPDLAEAVANLARAHGAVGQTVMQFLGWFQGGKMAFIPLNSERFLEMMSELAVGWLLLEQAALAIEKLGSVSESHPDHAFYLGKKYAAIYFAKNVLSLVPSKAKIIATADTSPNDIPDEAFATV